MGKNNKNIDRQILRKYFLQDVYLTGRVVHNDRDVFLDGKKHFLLRNVIIPEQNDVQGAVHLDHIWIDDSQLDETYIGKKVRVYGVIQAYQRRNGSYSFGIDPNRVDVVAEN